MYDTVCQFPLSADLFAQAIHPTEPLVATGLSSGHVACLRLPPTVTGSDESDAASLASVNGFGFVDTAWRTRRHKGSCRSLAFGSDGRRLYSAGTDGVVKVAETETGRVVDKILTSRASEAIDAPSLVHVSSPQTLLLATDSSALHLYDLRVDGSGGGGFAARKPQQTHYPHNDYISSLTALPPSESSTSGFSKQWVTTGGTTLSVTDLRRGVLVRSEDQEEELLSTCYASGTNKDKVIVGGGAGVLTLWEKGVWDDQDERIVVDRPAGDVGGESIDVLAMLPSDALNGLGRKTLAVGLGNGSVHFVQLGVNKVVGAVNHESPADGVVGLDFDVGGRMITGGGSLLKIWTESLVDDDEEDEDEDEQDSSDDSSSSGVGTKPQPNNHKKNTSQLPGGKSFSFAGLD